MIKIPDEYIRSAINGFIDDFGPAVLALKSDNAARDLVTTALIYSDFDQGELAQMLAFTIRRLWHHRSRLATSDN